MWTDRIGTKPAASDADAGDGPECHPRISSRRARALSAMAEAVERSRRSGAAVPTRVLPRRPGADSPATDGPLKEVTPRRPPAPGIAVSGRADTSPRLDPRPRPDARASADPRASDDRPASTDPLTLIGTGRAPVLVGGGHPPAPGRPDLPARGRAPSTVAAAGVGTESGAAVGAISGTPTDVMPSPALPPAGAGVRPGGMRRRLRHARWAAAVIGTILVVALAALGAALASSPSDGRPGRSALTTRPPAATPAQHASTGAAHANDALPATGVTPGATPGTSGDPLATAPVGGTATGRGTAGGTLGTGTAGSHIPGTGWPATTGSSTSAAVGRPLVLSLSPASGAAGQTITVTGTGFYDPGGPINVSFGGQPAPISCPSQMSCTVTVPTGPAAGEAVPVTVTTGTGTSNAATFTYW